MGMAAIDVVNSKGEKVSERELVDALFDVAPKASVLHDVVTAQLAARRSGTASTKRRGDVRGSTRKLYRQKGTGRARRGDIKSPLMRGGGVIFGPHPRSHALKVSKKLRRLALKMALTSKLQEKQLLVLEKFDLQGAKTKEFMKIARDLKLDNALIVIDQRDENLELSSRNVPRIKVLRSEGLNVYDILAHDNLVLLEPAIDDIEGRLLA
jgi:large subunit ribosomal protein L4